MSKKLSFILVTGIALFVSFNIYLYIDYQKFKKRMTDSYIVHINKGEDIISNKQDRSHDQNHDIHSDPVTPLNPNVKDSTKVINGQNTNDIIPDAHSEAQKRLEHIRDNPEKWGHISQRGGELINMLLPVWDNKSEESIENSIILLDELAELKDPRSAEVFVKYFLYSHWGRKQENALIDIGVPAIPYLVDYINSDHTGRDIVVSRLLGIIASQHKKELSVIIDDIIIPGLNRMIQSSSDSYIQGEINKSISMIAN